jgi:hypothetical protein
VILSRGRYWRASLRKRSVSMEIEKAALPDDLFEIRDLRFDVPLAKWNRLVKNLNSDRKLLGGLLLDFATHKDRVSPVAGNDRVLGEFRRCVLDATVTLVEEEILVLSMGEINEEEGR